MTDYLYTCYVWYNLVLNRKTYSGVCSFDRTVVGKSSVERITLEYFNNALVRNTESFYAAKSFRSRNIHCTDMPLANITFDKKSDHHC